MKLISFMEYMGWILLHDMKIHWINSCCIYVWSHDTSKLGLIDFELLCEGVFQSSTDIFQSTEPLLPAWHLYKVDRTWHNVEPGI